LTITRQCEPASAGGSAAVIMSDRLAAQKGLKTTSDIFRGLSAAGLEPDERAAGRSTPCRVCSGARIEDRRHRPLELNEALAVKVIYCRDKPGIDPHHPPPQFRKRSTSRARRIAVGHPYGMTGARLTATLDRGSPAQGENTPFHDVRGWRMGAAGPSEIVH